MTKKELIAYMAEKAELGWMTHSTLLSLYENDEDEVPDDFVNVICHEPIKPQPTIFFMGSDMADRIYQMLKDFINPPKNE